MAYSRNIRILQELGKELAQRKATGTWPKTQKERKEVITIARGRTSGGWVRPREPTKVAPEPVEKEPIPLAPTKPELFIPGLSKPLREIYGIGLEQLAKKETTISPKPTTKPISPVIKQAIIQSVGKTHKPLPGYEQIGIPARQVLRVAMSKDFRSSPTAVEDATKQIMLTRAKTKDIGAIYKKNQFLSEHPDVEFPTNPYGAYDRVTVGTPMYNEAGQLVPGYQFSYSPEAKHKINIAGSPENYDAYLSMVRSHPELAFAYSLSGGKGVGPLDIIPTIGVDLALASNKPGIAGGSEMEEILVKYLHKVKGSPEGGPTVEGLAGAIIENPMVQWAAGSAAMVLGAEAFKLGVRATPRVLAKLSPSARTALAKIISQTKQLAPKSSQITLHGLKRNVLKWAMEGAVPAIKTTPRVISSSQIVDKLFKKGVTYIDDIGNIVLEATKKRPASIIGYIDDFNRVILYKPKRVLGFVEREFISPGRAATYKKLMQNIPLSAKEKALLRGKVPGYEYGSFYNRAILEKKLLSGKPLTSSEQAFLQGGLIPDESLIKVPISKAKPRKAITEFDLLMRGESGKFAELQALITQEAYKKKFLKGVYHPYRATELKLRWADISKYTPDEALLTETEAIQRAILKGKVPGRTYGSLYNIQAYRDFGLKLPELARGVLPEELLYKDPKFLAVLKKDPTTAMRNIFKNAYFDYTKNTWMKVDPLTGRAVTLKSTLPKKVADVIKKTYTFSDDATMRNIWAGKKYNILTGKYEEATASLVRQPKLISAEERAITRMLKAGEEVFGKGASYGALPQQFMIPVQRSGLEAFISFFGFRPMVYRKTERDVFQTPEKTHAQILKAMQIQRQKQIQDVVNYQKQLLNLEQEQITRQEQAIKQAQEQAQATMPFTITETIFKEPIPPRGTRSPPPRGGSGLPIFPLWPYLPLLPGMGGKVAGRGRAEPYDVRYYNEYEALQRLMRNVIF